MKQDPIVEETRQARAKLFAECGGDLGKLLDRLKASERQDKDRLVTADALRKGRRAHPPVRPAKR